MTKFDTEFENIVNSIQFDDMPSETHRRQLEQRLVAAYDKRSQQGGHMPPSGVFYIKRVAVAAGFVLAAGLLYYLLDDLGPAPLTQPAYMPDAHTVDRLLRQESVTDANRQALLQEIQQVWPLVAAGDVQALTAVIMDARTADSIRLWAADTVVERGTAAMLERLEKHIEAHALTEPDDPVVQTAHRLRQRIAAERNP